MNRSKINFIVDIFAFIDFFFLLSTGILIRFILPKGSGESLAVWGMTRHQWGDIHFWLAIAGLALILLHLMLHWSWIVCMIKGKVKERADLRTIAAIFIFLAMLIVAVAPLIAPKTGVSGGGRGQHRYESK